MVGDSERHRRPASRELDLRRRSGKAIRERLGFAPDGIVVGTVARLEPVKGVDVLVAAAPVILEAAPGVRFLIVGDGSRRESLEGLARKLGVSDRMVFAGHQGSPLDWMSAMDVYAQPSVNEGLGRALIEAAVLGLPAAASAVCGIPDVVADGRTGLLSPPGDPVALARSILRLASDPGLRGSMGEQARLRVLRPDENGLPFFSSQAMIRKLEGLYASLRPAP
jgi:glycosyltransferase involved in cell wall biosynthesis